MESVFAVVMLVMIALGIIEVTFALYGRNVVVSSAHEGARAAIELGRDPAHARAVAIDTIERATGRLVRDLRVDAVTDRTEARSIVRVRVDAVLNALGPLSLPIPVSATATTVRAVTVP